MYLIILWALPPASPLASCLPSPWSLPAQPNRTGSRSCSYSFGRAPWTCFSSRRSLASLRISVTQKILQVASVGQVLGELIGVVLAQNFDRGGQLLLFDLLVLLLLVRGLQTLPGEHASQEVHGDVANRLQIVSSAWIKSNITLLDSQVGINGGISSSSSEVLPLSVGNVSPVLLDVSLGKSEIEQEDLVRSLVQSNAEIVWLDVSVKEMPGMNILNSLDHLIHQDQNSFQGELPQGLIEQSLQWRAHQVHDKDVVISLGRAVVDIGNPLINDTGVVVKVIIKLAFIDELRMICSNWLQLDGNFQIGSSVDGLIDLAEGSLIDLSNNLEVSPHPF